VTCYHHDLFTSNTQLHHYPAGKTMQHSEGFLKLVDDAKTRVRELSVEQTRERLQSNPNAKLIDVREDNEWERSHAAQAVHLGRGIIERDIEHDYPDKDAELILYCGGGFRSALACDNLQRMGYTNAYSMAGGWKAWQDAGAPVEGGEKN
jgi:rhodanese-related sulfurtransferase